MLAFFSGLFFVFVFVFVRRLAPFLPVPVEPNALNEFRTPEAFPQKMSLRHPSVAAQRDGPESSHAGSDHGGNNESDESDRKPYLDRLTMSAHRSAAGQPWEGLLLQPVSIPNLDHIGACFLFFLLSRVLLHFVPTFGGCF